MEPMEPPLDPPLTVTTRCEATTKVLSQQERLPNPLALCHWTQPISKYYTVFKEPMSFFNKCEITV